MEVSPTEALVRSSTERDHFKSSLMASSTTRYLSCRSCGLMSDSRRGLTSGERRMPLGDGRGPSGAAALRTARGGPTAPTTFPAGAARWAGVWWVSRSLPPAPRPYSQGGCFAPRGAVGELPDPHGEQQRGLRGAQTSRRGEPAALTGRYQARRRHGAGEVAAATAEGPRADTARREEARRRGAGRRCRLRGAAACGARPARPPPPPRAPRPRAAAGRRQGEPRACRQSPGDGRAARPLPAGGASRGALRPAVAAVSLPARWEREGSGSAGTGPSLKHRFHTQPNLKHKSLDVHSTQTYTTCAQLQVSSFTSVPSEGQISSSG